MKAIIFCPVCKAWYLESEIEDATPNYVAYNQVSPHDQKYQCKCGAVHNEDWMLEDCYFDNEDDIVVFLNSKKVTV